MAGTKRPEIVRHYALEFLPIERVAMSWKYSCDFDLVAVGQGRYSFYGFDVVRHARIGQIVQHGTLVDHIAAKQHAIVLVEQSDTSARMAWQMNHLELAISQINDIAVGECSGRFGWSQLVILGPPIGTPLCLPADVPWHFTMFLRPASRRQDS